MRIAEFVVAIIIICAPVRLRAASDLEPLQGKWAIFKTNQQGQIYSQTIEIEKDQLTFQILGADSKPRFVSKGTVKVTKAAPFDLLSVSDIRAGSTQDDMQPLDDTRAFVYTLRGDNLFFASSFDKVRENEKPGVEIYVRKPAEQSADEKLLGNWKMDVTVGDTNYDYKLRITRAGNQLEGVLISPRSGEHPCKTVQFKNGELLIEIDRPLDGDPVTFIYQGKPTADGLSGKFEVKGREDQLSGTWKASKG